VPAAKLGALEALSELTPGEHETQPYLAVGIKGGTRPGRGKIMVDTGAAFTMMTLAVARMFGLTVREDPAVYSVASGSSAPLVGITDFTLQVSDELELVMSSVRVSKAHRDD
jgi:Aspartyl protease